jgi:ABC-2 type transport system permease protein
MKSFSEEKKLGTLELLFIKPISLWETVLGKFLGSLCLALIAILPTLLYVYTISQLGVSIGNLDIGPVLGSYFGLLFLIASYTAIGLFTSTLSENQIVAFIIGMALCFVMLYGFESLATILPNGPMVLLVEQLGMKAHFESVARGVLDTRDIIYFASLTIFFLYLTVNRLQNQNR